MGVDKGEPPDTFTLLPPPRIRRALPPCAPPPPQRPDGGVRNSHREKDEDRDGDVCVNACACVCVLGVSRPRRERTERSCLSPLTTVDEILRLFFWGKCGSRTVKVNRAADDGWEEREIGGEEGRAQQAARDRRAREEEGK